MPSPIVNPPTPYPAYKLALRNKLIALARNEIGTKSGRLYWSLAYKPGYTKSLDKYAWCGLFALAMLRLAGITDRWWTAGSGFIYTAEPVLPITKDPRPGDIAYQDQPNQHYGIITEIHPDYFVVIAGNTPNVAEQKLKKSVTVAYSIEPYLDNLPKDDPTQPQPPPSPPTPPPTLPPTTTPLAQQYDALVRSLIGREPNPLHHAACVIAIGLVESGGKTAAAWSRDKAIGAYLTMHNTNQPADRVNAEINAQRASSSFNLYGYQFVGEGKWGVDFFYYPDKHTDGTPYIARFRIFPDAATASNVISKWLKTHPSTNLVLSCGAPYPALAASLKTHGYYEGDQAAYAKLLATYAQRIVNECSQLPVLKTFPYPALFDPLGAKLPTVYWIITAKATPAGPIWGTGTKVMSKTHSYLDAIVTFKRINSAAGAGPMRIAARYPGGLGWTGFTDPTPTA